VHILTPQRRLRKKRASISDGAKGFKPSQHDPCLFTRHDDVAFVVYVDDVIFVSKSQKVIDQCIAQFIEDGYDLDPERGHLAGFLGHQDRERERQLRQSYWQSSLSASISDRAHPQSLEAGGVQEAKFTPALEALKACKDCPLHDEVWNYRSVEGMMMYLAQNTRPDIAMAVHQAARFANDPRDVH
jgi:hypothetical protein